MALADLDRLRRIAATVEVADRSNVETAIALACGSAQLQVQIVLGEFDYFEPAWPSNFPR